MWITLSAAVKPPTGTPGLLLRADPAGLQNVGMAGMASPDAGAGPGARPELRASHEDRDHAVEILPRGGR